MVDVLKLSKAFSDKNRVKILKMLSDGDRNVGTVADELNVEENLASHHLRVLFNLGLLKNSKKGREVYYSLNKRRIVLVMKDLNQNEFFRDAMHEAILEEN